jgi:hypothetical protein
MLILLYLHRHIHSRPTMAARTMQPITSMIRYITGISEQEKINVSTTLTRVGVHLCTHQGMVCSHLKKKQE